MESIQHTSGHDGLLLAFEHFGTLSARPSLIFTHGFGQNRLAWRSTAKHLAQIGWSGFSFDGRGHGHSAWSPNGNYELDDFVWDLTEIARNPALVGVKKPVLIGASMGGLLALLAQAQAGESGLFSAIVLVDVTPRWEAEGVGRIFEFMSAFPHGFESLQQAADAVNQYLPHREQKDPKRLRQHLREGEDGRLRWHWDPKLLEHIPRASERYIPRLEAAARSVRCPVLLLSGGKSDVVSAQTIASFQALVPHAQHRQIEHATHMVVGDRNDQFSAEIEAYLGQLERDSNFMNNPSVSPGVQA